MNKKLKTVLIIVFVPSAIAGAYFAYNFLDKRYKLKKAVSTIDSTFDKIAESHKENQPLNMKEVIVKEWETELKKLSDEGFKSFYDFMMVTLPNGKNKEKNIWNYEETNAVDFALKKAEMDKYADHFKNTKVLEYYKDLMGKI